MTGRTLNDIRREQADLRAEARKLRPEKVRQVRTAPTAAGQRQPRALDDAYVTLIHALPCFAGLVGSLGPCTGMIEASHVKLAIASRGLRGWGVQERSDDWLALPCCAGHHQHGGFALHRIGERKFYDRLGFGDGIADLCRDLHAAAPDLARMRSELLRHVRYAKEQLHRSHPPPAPSSPLLKGRRDVGERTLFPVETSVRPSSVTKADIADALHSSVQIARNMSCDYDPTEIVAMVSGGRDSALAHSVAAELGLPLTLILHGNTRTGIRETTEFVTDHYGNLGPDFAVADAGDAYERYVMRKGFFGKGRGAHNFSYRILKADPFRAAISRLIRKGRRGHRIALINGVRKSESENRRVNAQITRLDKGNLWVNLCHHWTSDVRDAYLASRGVPINPVAVQLCRSGECMCGTMQARGERLEAAALYPEWGGWLNDLEAAVVRKHGFGWDDTGPAHQDPNQQDLFQPMCAGCERRAAT